MKRMTAERERGMGLQDAIDDLMAEKRGKRLTPQETLLIMIARELLEARRVRAVKKVQRENLRVAMRENEKLRRAVAWALGEGDSDFGEKMPGATGATPRYWWRTELARLARGD